VTCVTEDGCRKNCWFKNASNSLFGKFYVKIRVYQNRRNHRWDAAVERDRLY